MGASSGQPTYRLSGEEFDSLGSGYGSESAVATIRSAQLSKRLLLLVAAHRAGGLDGDAWRLLRDLTADRPDIGRELLAHPFVDTWATRYLRGRAEAESADGGYLSSLAVSAAVRAGVDLDLPLETPTGELYVPTVGLAYGLGVGQIAVRVRAGGLMFIGRDTTVTVPAPYTTDAPGWHASRDFTVRSSAGSLTVTIEDLDPHRSCFGHRVASRLTSAQAARLWSLTDGAWQLIAADHPEHATAIGTCVRSLVPLVRPPTGSASASTQSAFGAVAVSTPDRHAELALLLIHETQHLKLGALFDFVDLFSPAADGLYHAPWRADPRPPRALFQGVYAHAGVADFWRVRRMRVTDDEAQEADFEFAYWLAQTRLAAGALAGSGALTPHGERFVAQLMTTLDAWGTAPVDRALATGVEDLMTAVAVRWRLDNHRPETGSAARLATVWREGRACPAVGPASVAAAAGGGPARVEGLAERIQARLTASEPPPSGPAEVAYLDGRVHDAIEAYRAAATARPDDPLAWVGLAVTVARGGDTGAARVLFERPDLVRATFAVLRQGGSHPTPDALAGWLAPAVS